MPFFERLVDVFYEGVATDDVLLPLYPEQPDLVGARHRIWKSVGIPV
jgi:hemoglobin